MVKLLFILRFNVRLYFRLKKLVCLNLISDFFSKNAGKSVENSPHPTKTSSRGIFSRGKLLALKLPLDNILHAENSSRKISLKKKMFFIRFLIV
jgi:hypothetical protein